MQGLVKINDATVFMEWIKITDDLVIVSELSPDVIVPEIIPDVIVPEHLKLVKSEIIMTSDTTTKAVIKTAGTIPKINTASSFFGYAIDIDGVLAVVTTHNGFFDSETQNELKPDGVWHVHMVDTTTQTACDSGLAIDRVSFDENGKVKVTKSRIIFSDISRDTLDLTNALTGNVEEFKLGQPNGVVASFTISTVGADETFNICIDNLNPLEPAKFTS